MVENMSKMLKFHQLIHAVYSMIFGPQDFGCDFGPTGYKLATPPQHSPVDPFFVRPVYGEVRQPLILKSNSDLNDLAYKIDSITSQVTMGVTYNSVNNYQEFYENYKRSGQDIRTFYASYTPNFRPAENCIGLVIEVLHRIHTSLVFSYPSIRNHTFLVSSRNQTLDWMRGEEWDTTEEGDDLQLLAGARVTKHVMGALKVKVGNRTGIILIDQGYGYRKAIILMKDGKAPTRDVTFTPIMSNKYRYTHEDRYVQWTIGHLGILSTSVPCEYHRVYIHRPYCSFMYGAEKLSLLDEFRYIVRREEYPVHISLGAMVTLKETMVNLLLNRRISSEMMSPQTETIDIDVSLKQLLPMLRTHGKTSPNATSKRILDLINTINGKARLGKGALVEKLQKLITVQSDEEFIKGIRKIREDASGQSSNVVVL